MTQPLILEGQRILIVGGGGGGTGRAITRTSAAAGAQVAIVDIDPQRASEAADEIVRAGGTAFGLPGDIRSASEVERLVRESRKAMDGIDVLITVAGGQGLFAPFVPVHETTDESWDTLFDINVMYVFRFTRAVLNVFLEQGHGGVIVGVGSIASFSSQPHGAPYGAAKAALVSLARTVAVEYSRENIRMNIVNSGAMGTPAARGVTPTNYGENVPMGYLGEPQDVADAAVFLASNHSKYISGQALNVDGAATARHPLRIGHDAQRRPGLTTGTS